MGIFLGLLAGIGACLLTGAIDPTWELAGIAGGAAIVFAFGLIDDLRSLPPPAKLAGQFAAAGVVIASGIRVEIVDNGLVGTALGLLWLVAITNAFNLLDNMDGLAGSLAVVGALFFAIDAVWIHSDDLLLVVSLALALAVAGFLPYNFRPRKPAAVFMGDSGSQVIGLTLAALGLATSWKVAESTVATLIIPLLVLAIPILDTALVTAVRLVEGRPIHQGGRDHTSHRLVRSGISEKGTVVLLTAIAAGLGLTSLAYSGLDNGWVTLVGVLVTFALLVQLAGFLTDIDEGERVVDGKPVRLSKILLSPRRLVEVAVDFALISASFTIAYLLFVDGSGTDYQKHIFLVSLPAILAARYLCFIPAGLYSGVWRFAGAREAAAIIVAVIVSEGLAYGVVWFTSRPFGDFPQTDLRAGRADRDGAGRRLALRRARPVSRPRDVPRPSRAPPYAARRRGPQRPQPAARAAGDAGRAGRGLRRRRSQASRPPHAGRAGARHAPGDRPRPRPVAARPRARDHPLRAARPPRRGGASLRAGASTLQIRAQGSRSGPGRRDGRRGRMTTSAAPAAAAGERTWLDRAVRRPAAQRRCSSGWPRCTRTSRGGTHRRGSSRTSSS